MPIKIFTIFLIIFSLISLNSFAVNVSPTLMLQEAQKYLEKGYLDKAENICDLILKKEPKFYPALNMLGIIYARKLGGEQQAIYYLNHSLDIQKKQPQVYVQISSLYNAIGQTETAISYLEEGKKIAPDDYQINYHLGFFYLIHRQDAFEAAKLLEIAQTHNPNNIKLLYITGLSHAIAGNKAIALEYITRLKTLKSEDYANKLENILRGGERNQGVDMLEVMEDYTKSEPKRNNDENTNTVQPVHVNDKSEVSVTSSETSVKGQGIVSIKQSFTPKKENKDSEGETEGY